MYSSRIRVCLSPGPRPTPLMPGSTFDVAGLLPRDWPPLVSLRMICRATGITMSQLRHMLAVGQLPAPVKINPRVHLLPTDQVRQALARLTQPEGVANG